MCLQMDLKILSWNLRGSNTPEKLHQVRRLVRKHNPLFVGLQETKRSFVNFSTARELWGTNPHKWSFLPSIGASGGLVLIWDADRVEFSEVLIRKFSISLLCNLVVSNVQWVITNAYGPCLTKEKTEFWKELFEVGLHWNVPWLLFGDFNAVRAKSERTGVSTSRKEMREFNSFVDDLGLLEFDKFSPSFSFSNSQISSLF